MKDAPRIGHNTDNEVCAFVDKYITVVMPKPCKENEHDISLIKSLQKHTHSEKSMGETLKRVAQECWNDDVHAQMNKIKNEFLGKQVLATPESYMCVMSMWFMKKSRKVQNVNKNMQDEHVSLPKWCRWRMMMTMCLQQL